MRITRQSLLKNARDAVRRRTARPRNVLAAYLCGSLVGAEPFLGGTADIDLVFVHNSEAAQPREVERLTDEVHLDIAHHTRATYRRGRLLREDPWLGPTLYHCLILHDPQHFLDFTQAAVRGLYHKPDTVLRRAQQLAETARQIWMELDAAASPPERTRIALYLDAVAGGANAVASLSGPPITERRLLLDFPDRAAEVGKPGLELAVTGLLGGMQADAETLRSWIPVWEAALEAAGDAEGAHVSLHADRRLYYLRAVETLLESGRPLTALWPMLRTWMRALADLPAGSEAVSDWKPIGERLQLLDAAFNDRVAALDAFLDTVEETLETWGDQQGVTVYGPIAS